MREDYQEYWREKEEEQSEEVPEASIVPTTLSFRLRTGGRVLVRIDEAEAEFSYGNGAQRRIPLADLRYCPECLRSGFYPFLEEKAGCAEHGFDGIPFELEDFERFQLLSMMSRTKAV